MSSVDDVASSGGSRNLPNVQPGQGTPPQPISPSPAGAFAPSVGAPPEPEAGRYVDTSFRAPGDASKAEEFKPGGQAHSRLLALGVEDARIKEIIRKRPNDGVQTLRRLISLNGELAPLYPPRQLARVAASCGLTGLDAMSYHRNVLMQFSPDMANLLIEELSRYGDGVEASLSYRPEKLVNIAVNCDPEALKALREHGEALRIYGHTPFELTTVAHDSGADGLGALLAFHEAINDHRFTAYELADMAAISPHLLQDLVKHPGDLKKMSKLDIISRVGREVPLFISPGRWRMLKSSRS